MSNGALEREVPDVSDDDTKMIGPWPMARVDPVAELAAFEAAAELQKKLITASIRATKPQDWVEMGGKVYLQATGVERISPLWGLLFGEPTVIKEDIPGGGYEYIVSGSAGSRRTGVYYKAITGGRSSTDPFFDQFDEDKPSGFKQLPIEEQRQWKAAHRIAPDPLDVRKAAITNWMTRSASMLTGMRGLTSSDLKAAGIEGVARVEYGSGAKGGDASPADLKAKRTALWNDIVKRTGGDPQAAKDLLKEVTAYAGYKNKTTGKDVPANLGSTSTDNLSDRAIDIAQKKVKEHATWGDNPEPGSGD